MNTDTSSNRVTQLLQAWSGGDQCARDELVPIVYDTLRRLARGYLSGERHAATLQPTALVHEAYMRLVEQQTPGWESRGHFYAVAAQLIRQVLVDHARRRLSAKRGAGAVRVDLTDISDLPAPGPAIDLLQLDDSLQALTQLDERKARAVELRYFGGCTEEEISRSLTISVATVRRDLRTAEAWLAVRLNP
jgi:RNA polymerase sigma factor (TIGR02999 family)